MRNTLAERLPLKVEKERWMHEIDGFRKEFKHISAYPEK